MLFLPSIIFSKEVIWQVLLIAIGFFTAVLAFVDVLKIKNYRFGQNRAFRDRVVKVVRSFWFRAIISLGMLISSYFITQDLEIIKNTKINREIASRDSVRANADELRTNRIIAKLEGAGFTIDSLTQTIEILKDTLKRSNTIISSQKAKLIFDGKFINNSTLIDSISIYLIARGNHVKSISIFTTSLISYDGQFVLNKKKDIAFLVSRGLEEGAAYNTLVIVNTNSEKIKEYLFRFYGSYIDSEGMPQIVDEYFVIARDSRSWRVVNDSTLPTVKSYFVPFN